MGRATAHKLCFLVNLCEAWRRVALLSHRSPAPAPRPPLKYHILAREVAQPPLRQGIPACAFETLRIISAFDPKRICVSGVQYATRPTTLLDNRGTMPAGAAGFSFLTACSALSTWYGARANSIQRKAAPAYILSEAAIRCIYRTRRGGDLPAVCGHSHVKSQVPAGLEHRSA